MADVTPERLAGILLNAHEMNSPRRAPSTRRLAQDVLDLCAALRQAWTERDQWQRQVEVTEAAYAGCSGERELLARDLKTTEDVRDQACAEVTRLVGRAVQAESARDASRRHATDAEKRCARLEAMLAGAHGEATDLHHEVVEVAEEARALRKALERYNVADDNGDAAQAHEDALAALSRPRTAHAAVAEARREVVEAERAFIALWGTETDFASLQTASERRKAAWARLAEAENATEAPGR